jgi:2'-5' RNA ligase
MIRSFVAIDLSDSAKEVLEEVGQRLRSQAPHKCVRWSRVTAVHLTLKFLGDVAEADLPEIKDVLAQVARRHVPFTFTIGGLGCFPNVKRPRVVWVGVQEETGALAALQRDVEKNLVPLGFEPEKRAFHPHLTLGRTRRNARPADRRRLGEIVVEAGVGELSRVHVESFRLMRSDLRPDGAVYTPLAVFDLTTDHTATDSPALHPQRGASDMDFTD